MERKMLSMSRRDKEQVSWVSEEKKAEAIFTTINHKTLIGAGRFMHRNDNRWTTQVRK